MVPLLTLGIPGCPVAALLLSGLIVTDLQPGAGSIRVESGRGLRVLHGVHSREYRDAVDDARLHQTLRDGVESSSLPAGSTDHGALRRRRLYLQQQDDGCMGAAGLRHIPPPG